MGLKEEFITIFKQLDKDLLKENAERRKSGATPVDPIQVKILGQTALLLANLPFPLAGTMDFDAQIEGDYLAKQKLEEILLPEGLHLDSDSHLVWIPEQAKYNQWYTGKMVTVFLLEPDAVITSKAKFKRAKDKELIRVYLQNFPASEKRIATWGISTKWIET